MRARTASGLRTLRWALAAGVGVRDTGLFPASFEEWCTAWASCPMWPAHTRGIGRLTWRRAQVVRRHRGRRSPREHHDSRPRSRHPLIGAVLAQVRAPGSFSSWRMVSTGVWKWASRCSRSWWSQEERWWGGTSRMISSTGSLNRISSIASIGSWRTETEPMTGAWAASSSCGRADAESDLGLRRLVVAFGVQQVELGPGGVQHDQAELHVTVLGAVPDGVAQGRAGLGRVGHDQDAVGSAVGHGGLLRRRR